MLKLKLTQVDYIAWQLRGILLSIGYPHISDTMYKLLAYIKLYGLEEGKLLFVADGHSKTLGSVTTNVSMLKRSINGQVPLLTRRGDLNPDIFLDLEGNFPFVVEVVEPSDSDDSGEERATTGMPKALKSQNRQPSFQSQARSEQRAEPVISSAQPKAFGHGASPIIPPYDSAIGYSTVKYGLST